MSPAPTIPLSGSIPAASEQFGRATANPFGKSFLLGALLPATIFVLLWHVSITPLLPAVLLPRQFDILGEQWQATLFAGTILILAFLLYHLNPAIVRLYEGSPWQHGWWGARRVRHWQARFDEAEARVEGMHALLQTLDRESERYDEIVGRWNTIYYRWNQDFPNKRVSVLPTRLGNVIASFQEYPEVQYGMDATSLWPRLFPLADEAHVHAVHEAKTSFDFVLHASALSAVLAAAAGVAGIVYAPAFVFPRLFAMTAAFTGLSYVFYLLAIGRAAEWGRLYAGVFDLYRWKLLRQLGYEHPVSDGHKERAIWTNISLQIAFGDQILDGGERRPGIDYAFPATYAKCRRAKADFADFPVTRGMKRSGRDEGMTIFLAVENATGEPTDEVELVDTLPAGFAYQWGTCSASGHGVKVTGINPYMFSIEGALLPRERVEVRYRAVPAQVPEVVR